MDNKLNRVRSEVKKGEKTGYNQCLTCRKPCSMSGLCMRPWPEFSSPKTRKDANHSGNIEDTQN